MRRFSFTSFAHTSRKKMHILHKDGRENLTRQNLLQLFPENPT